MYSVKIGIVTVGLVLLLVSYGVIIPLLEVPDGIEQESFSSPGIYPSAVDNPLLADSYNVKTNPGYDNNGASNIYVNYPRFPAKHCGTNNIKYWRRPTNGLCSPPGMCMGLYDATEPTIPTPPAAPNGEPRVNYYVSSI